MDNIEQIMQKKEPKKRTKGKALSHKTIRSKGSDSVAHTSSNNKREQKANKRAAELVITARSRSLQAAEIDEYLIGLVMTGMIDDNYWKFHCKCMYTLGFQTYHQLVIESRSGNTPRNLLAFKLKGALMLHYKKQYYSDQYDIADD